ncbi:MAG TPA: response regulator [Opitutaceae bacterium]|jgi:CheY-like chemotaxis protein|nr:response regulator [Opitutaceae bacterium]
MPPIPSILLVENDHALLCQLHHTLEAEGYTVAGACHSRDAGVMIRDQYFDLLIIDVLFPGRQTIDAIVDRNRRVGTGRIVALCPGGRHLPPYYHQLIARLGVREILATPCERPQLLSSVQRALAWAPEPAPGHSRLENYFNSPR